MSDFNFESIEKNDKTIFKFFGSLKEEATLPDLAGHEGKEIHLNLDQMGFINSIGIRTWIVWIEKFNNFKFVFSNIPTSFVDQMNLVVGFVPSDCRVDSLYVPFDCTECNDDVKILFKNNEDFKWENNEVQVLAKEFKCGVCGHPVDWTTSEQKYFRFLND